MMKSSFSAVGISVAVHAIVLIAMAMVQMNILEVQPEIALETVFEEERVQEEFSKELEMATEIAETMNVISGGVVSTQIGGSGAPAVAQEKIEQSETFDEPDVQLNVAAMSIPGLNEIGTDLGEAEISGDIGQPVAGYGAALGRITQELLRLMREQRCHVVWLFDESESMKDDQQEISRQFHKVYEELGIAQKQDKNLRQTEKVLLTSIIGFGKGLHPLTKEPTADISEIRAAIDKVGVDDSGDENMCQSIIAAIKEYEVRARRQDRRLVVVVVSDESPTDDEAVEETIRMAQRSRAPVYILGREAIFGYPYARLTWRDPQYGLTHWIRIERGPETAFPEALQYDGLHARWDSFSSGFGPYSQVRLAKESGGIFFVLPSEEQNLAGAGAHEKRKFDFLAMKEYQPLLLPRREYAEARDRSEFRRRIWEVILLLNPHLDPKLNIAVHHYPLEPNEFRAYAGKEFQKVARAMTQLTKAVAVLKDVEPLRDKEASRRWRANYDLILAQCLSYRMLLFQYMLAVDHHAREMPKPKDPKANEWRVGRRKQSLEPTDEQFADIKKLFNIKVSKEEYLAELKAQEKQALERYAFVEEEHPGTPWQRRAQHERTQGFGIHFYDFFYDPRYRKPDIKIPKF